MDYKEEQVQELEVLESIYPDEIEYISKEYPNIHFEVSVKLELETDLDINREHTMMVDITFPENYPDVAPILKLTSKVEIINEDEEEGDDDDDDEDKTEFDEHGNIVIAKLANFGKQIDFKDYTNELEVEIDEMIERDMLLGMQMCFTIISTVKDNSEQWFQNELSKLEKEYEKEKERLAIEEQKKFNGTKVTKESYLKWRQGFRKELKLDERDTLRREKAHNGKLTGRQMFEQGIVGLEEDEVIENLKEVSI